MLTIIAAYLTFGLISGIIGVYYATKDELLVRDEFVTQAFVTIMYTLLWPAFILMALLMAIFKKLNKG